MHILSTFHEPVSELVDIYNKNLSKKQYQQSIIDKLSINAEQLEEIPLELELGTFPRKQLKNDNMNKPAQQISYQQNMRGVDQFDQHASYNSIDIKSKYPYMRVVLHLIEVAINNAYIIFSHHANENSKKKYSERLIFRKQVCRSLVDALRDQNGFVNSQRSQPLEEEPEKESFNSVSLLLILILAALAGKIAPSTKSVSKRPSIGAQGVSYTTVRAAMLRLIRKLNASIRKNRL